jgi:chromosome segregation ATPase
MLRGLFGDDQTEHIEALEARVQELETEGNATSTFAAGLESALRNSQEKLSQTTSELEQWKSATMNLKQELDTVKKTNDGYLTRLARLNDDIKQLQAKYDAKTSDLRSKHACEKESLKEKYRVLEEQNTATLQVHGALKVHNNDLQSEHNALQNEHNALQSEHDKSTEQLAAALAENAELKSKQEKLNAQIHLMMENMNKRNEAYESSRENVEQNLKDEIEEKDNEINNLRHLVDAMKQENNKKIGIIAHLQSQCNAFANAVPIPQALEVDESPRLGKRLRITP